MRCSDAWAAAEGSITGGNPASSSATASNSHLLIEAGGPDSHYNIPGRLAVAPANMAGPGGSSDLDLPDWNVAFKEDSFDCSPVKQPLVQVRWLPQPRRDRRAQLQMDSHTQTARCVGRPADASPHFSSCRYP